MQYILLLVLLSSVNMPQSKGTTSGMHHTSYTVHNQTSDNLDNDSYTIEDSIRYQIGGKLYGLSFGESDSITVINALYRQDKEEVYREYHFIVHNRHSYAHNHFENTTLDSIYKASMAMEHNRYITEMLLQFDSIQSKHIDLAIKDFKDYWIYLKEYKGTYYLNDPWDFRQSFCISDSLFYTYDMDGPYPQKIMEAIPLPRNGISIICNNGATFKIELLDKERFVYLLDEKYFVAPTRAIHNFEIIQYTNTTGDIFGGM